MPKPNQVVLASFHCLCRSGPSLWTHIYCFWNLVYQLFTHDDFSSHRCSPLLPLYSQRVMKLSLNSFIYYFRLFRWQMSWSKQWAGARSLPPPYEKLTAVSGEWMDCSLTICLSGFPFFPFFVASVKCKSSHLTLPQTVSHSLPSHLINHAIELNATQQKKKKKKKEGSWQREWGDFSLFFIPSRCNCNFQAGSFVTVHVFHRAHCLIGFTEGPFFITTSLSACH